MRGPTNCIVCALLASIGGSQPLRAHDVNRSTGLSGPILVLDAGGHTSSVTGAVFTPDGRQLITVSEDKTIRVWDVNSLALASWCATRGRMHKIGG